MAVAALQVLEHDRPDRRAARSRRVRAGRRAGLRRRRVPRRRRARRSSCSPRSTTPPTRHAVEVERSFLAELGSGCSLPVGAHVDGGDAARVPRRPSDGAARSRATRRARRSTTADHERGPRGAPARAHARGRLVMTPRSTARASPSPGPEPASSAIGSPTLGGDGRPRPADRDRRPGRRRRRAAPGAGPAGGVRLARRHVGQRRPARRAGGRRRTRRAARRRRAGDGGRARRSWPVGRSTSCPLWPSAEGLLAEFPPAPARGPARPGRPGARRLLADGLARCGHDVEAVDRLPRPWLAHADRPTSVATLDAASTRSCSPAARRPTAWVDAIGRPAAPWSSRSGRHGRVARGAGLAVTRRRGVDRVADDAVAADRARRRRRGRSPGRSVR